MCAILSLCLGARWLTCVSICQFSSLESVRRGSPTTASPGIVSFHSDAYAILCIDATHDTLRVRPEAGAREPILPY